MFSRRSRSSVVSSYRANATYTRLPRPPQHPAKTSHRAASLISTCRTREAMEEGAQERGSMSSEEHAMTGRACPEAVLWARWEHAGKAHELSKGGSSGSPECAETGRVSATAGLRRVRKGHENRVEVLTVVAEHAGKGRVITTARCSELTERAMTAAALSKVGLAAYEEMEGDCSEPVLLIDWTVSLKVPPDEKDVTDRTRLPAGCGKRALPGPCWILLLFRRWESNYFEGLRRIRPPSHAISGGVEAETDKQDVPRSALSSAGGRLSLQKPLRDCG